MIKHAVITLLTIIGVTSPIVIHASSPYSQAQVIKLPDSKVHHIFRECSTKQCFTKALKGQPNLASKIAFIKNQEYTGFLAEFKEKGLIDLGLISYPTRANTNEAYVLLNGQPSIITTEINTDTKSFQASLKKDSNYPTLIKQFPPLDLYGASAQFVKSSISNRKETNFIFKYSVIDGCHACGTTWSALVNFRFNAIGKFQGHQLIKLVKN